MNKEVKSKWIEALRSQEYNQSFDRLRDKNGYCCLGVLCDIHAKETGNEWVDMVKPIPCGKYYLGHVSNLPKEVIKWAGLEKQNPMLTVDMSASSCNDSHEYTFNQIADLIQENL